MKSGITGAEGERQNTKGRIQDELGGSGPALMIIDFNRKSLG
jgi:hypothetical protein